MVGDSGKRPFSSLPPAFRQHAANVACWFPEVLMVLGAPDLEENFFPGQLKIWEQPCGKSVEVALHHRALPAASQALSVRQQSHNQVLASLDRLAEDLEQYTGQLALLNGMSGSNSDLRQVRASSRSSFNHRLDVVSDELLTLMEALALNAAEVVLQSHPRGERQSSVPAQGQDFQPPKPAQEADACTEEQNEVYQAPRSRPIGMFRVKTSPELALPERLQELHESQRHALALRGQDAGSQNLAVERSRKLLGDKASLQIEVHKVRRLPVDEPQSPKMVKASQIWGSSGANRRSQRETASPGTLQTRIQQKFVQRFGSRIE